MTELSIHVEAPSSFAEVDFEALRNELDRPLHIFADLESTGFPSKILYWNSVFDERMVTSIGAAAETGAIVGAHAITNRPIRGITTTRMFSEAMGEITPDILSLGEYPRFGRLKEHKPSGIMSQRLVDRIVSIEKIEKPTDEIAIAFFGDKYSDILEAEVLHQKTGIRVVAFWVEPLGGLESLIELSGRTRNSTREQRAAITNLYNSTFLKVT